MVESKEELLRETLKSSLAIVHTAAERNTPTPEVGDVWRARWQDVAGAVLVTHVGHGSLQHRTPVGPSDGSWEVDVVGGRDNDVQHLTEGSAHAVRVAPVSFDEEADDSAVVAPAPTHDIGVDFVVWIEDSTDVPIRVLEAKLGQLAQPGVDGLPRGTRNWGPTDPRTRHRARMQDLLDALAEATWAPESNTGVHLADLLATADIRDVAKALGSVQEAAQLRRGQGWLTPEQAEKLAPVLSKNPDELLEANPELPDDLVTTMDQPQVRAWVDAFAALRDQDEVTAWRTAAYGVFALAAREHTRTPSTNWVARVRAYFDAILDEPARTQGTESAESTSHPELPRPDRWLR